MKTISIFIVLISSLQYSFIYPQWEMIDSPKAIPDIRKVVCHPDGNLITITAENEVFRSDDNKKNWARVSVLTDEVKCLGITPQGIIYAGITEGYLKSIDNGVTWTKKQLFSNVSHVSDIEILENGNIIMNQACSDYPEYNRIWISSNNGSSWNYNSNGLNGGELIRLTKDSGENLYLLTRAGVILPPSSSQKEKQLYY